MGTRHDRRRRIPEKTSRIIAEKYSDELLEVEYRKKPVIFKPPFKRVTYDEALELANVLERLVEDEEFYKRFSYNRGNEPDYRDSGYPAYAIIDGSIFEGMKVEDIHNRYHGVYVTPCLQCAGRANNPLQRYRD